MWRAPRPEPSRVVERLDGLEDAVEVQQRLAHAHEDDVREVGAVLAPREPRGGAPDLVEDLGGREVTLEAQLAGRAERAPDGTAGLARDAERVPRPLAGPRPGSASAPTRWSARRASRWSAFSVCPPSASTDLLVDQRRPAKRLVDRGRRARAAASSSRPPSSPSRPTAPPGAGAPDRRARRARRATPPGPRPSTRTVQVADRPPRDGRPSATRPSRDRPPSRPPASARQTRGRVIGSSRSRTPTAAATAFAIAAAPAMTGASPMPFAPSGPSGAGTSTSVVPMRPMSSTRGKRIVQERAAQELSALVVDERLERRPAHRLGGRTLLLSRDERRIQHPADVLHDMVLDHRDSSGGTVDANPRDVPGDRRSEARLVDTGVPFDRRPARASVATDDLRDRDRALGRASRPNGAVDQLEVLDGDLELQRRRLEQSLPGLLGGSPDRPTGGIRDRAAAAARCRRRAEGVQRLHLHEVRRRFPARPRRSPGSHRPRRTCPPRRS